MQAGSGFQSINYYSTHRPTLCCKLTSSAHAFPARVDSIHHSIWRKIEQWGGETKKLSPYQQGIAGAIADKLSMKKKQLQAEIANACKLLDAVIPEVPELFHHADDLLQIPTEEPVEITPELLQKVVAWDKRAKKLKDYEYLFMDALAKGEKALTPHHAKLAGFNIAKARRWGFKE